MNTDKEGESGNNEEEGGDAKDVEEEEDENEDAGDNEEYLVEDSDEKEHVVDNDEEVTEDPVAAIVETSADKADNETDDGSAVAEHSLRLF